MSKRLTPYEETDTQERKLVDKLTALRLTQLRAEHAAQGTNNERDAFDPAQEQLALQNEFALRLRFILLDPNLAGRLESLAAHAPKKPVSDRYLKTWLRKNHDLLMRFDETRADLERVSDAMQQSMVEYVANDFRSPNATTAVGEDNHKKRKGDELDDEPGERKSKFAPGYSTEKGYIERVAKGRRNKPREV